MSSFINSCFFDDIFIKLRYNINRLFVATKEIRKVKFEKKEFFDYGLIIIIQFLLYFAVYATKSF